ncbi:MAG: hypothetical protein LBG31_04560, partial [Prevotellaceae bacterium]|jgi:uncharacterized protein (TIGR02145 family)|nr:hypothetical protein [Prevotellaceae bacterium]
VWIDLSPITGTSPGTFEKAEISGATATAGSIDEATLNGRGFYVTTNPSTVTATLDNASGKFNWCVYGSDAPPNVTADNGTYTLYGTPPFTLIAAGGTATQTVEATAITTSAVTITPVTLTDQTGCPGVFCIYTGSDLYIDATHLCQTRAGGAQNWEAWIKDTRDSKIYRIVQMPDDHWWMAQPLAREAGTYSTNGTTGILYYADTTAGCPSKWAFPSPTDWENLVTDYGGTNYANIKTTTGWAGTGYAATGTDYYGISVAPTGAYAEGGSAWPAGWYNTKYTFQMGPSRNYPSDKRLGYWRGMIWGFGCARNSGTGNETCSSVKTGWHSCDLNLSINKDCYARAPLRCFRQL